MNFNTESFYDGVFASIKGMFPVGFEKWPPRIAIVYPDIVTKLIG